jgi:heat shock protein HslJ
MAAGHRQAAMSNLRTLLAAILLPLALLAACSSAAAAPLDGRTFLSTKVTQKGADRPLVPGTSIRLTFGKDGQLGVSAGCNLMGGTWRIDGGTLRVDGGAMTEMGCDQPRMQQDQWLARLLGGAAINVAGDTLTLDDGTIRLTLLDREVASPDKPIEGTRWLLDGIVAGDAVSSVPAGVTASIRFNGGQVEVRPGCNTGSGTAAVTADTLTFGPIMLTKMACEPGAMSVEQAVVAALAGTVGYTIEADTLTIDAGRAGLIFRAAQ